MKWSLTFSGESEVSLIWLAQENVLSTKALLIRAKLTRPIWRGGILRTRFTMGSIIVVGIIGVVFKFLD